MTCRDSSGKVSTGSKKHKMDSRGKQLDKRFSSCSEFQDKRLGVKELVIVNAEKN